MGMVRLRIDRDASPEAPPSSGCVRIPTSDHGRSNSHSGPNGRVRESGYNVRHGLQAAFQRRYPRGFHLDRYPQPNNQGTCRDRFRARLSRIPADSSLEQRYNRTMTVIPNRGSLQISPRAVRNVHGRSVGLRQLRPAHAGSSSVLAASLLGAFNSTKQITPCAFMFYPVLLDGFAHKLDRRYMDRRYRANPRNSCGVIRTGSQTRVGTVNLVQSAGLDSIQSKDS